MLLCWEWDEAREDIKTVDSVVNRAKFVFVCYDLWKTLFEAAMKRLFTSREASHIRYTNYSTTVNTFPSIITASVYVLLEIFTVAISSNIVLQIHSFGHIPFSCNYYENNSVIPLLGNRWKLVRKFLWKFLSYFLCEFVRYLFKFLQQTIRNLFRKFDLVIIFWIFWQFLR